MKMFHLIVGALLSWSAVAASLQRDVSRSVNPGCSPSICNDSLVDDAVNLVHLEAVGPQDSIHALWSTVGAPAALIARTDNAVNLSVDWASFVGGPDIYADVAPSNEIHFSSTPSVAFGFILRQLVEYDDVDDVADPDHYEKTNKTIARKVFPLDDRRWSPVTIRDNDTFVFQTSPSDPDFGASLRLEVRMSGGLTRGEALPRLQLTPNNTHLDFFLDNMTSLFEHSRFYLVANVVNEDYPLKLSHVLTIDDEYTPGVFKTFRFGASVKSDTDKSRYAAWKPVAYTTEERSLEMQTQVKAFDQGPVGPSVNAVKSVVRAYFGRINLSVGDSKKIKIGFGQPNDKFYRASKYCVWSVLVGISQPPEDEISALVIIVISVGLGVPAVFVVLGGIYAGIQKRKESKSAGSPERKNDVNAPLMEEPTESSYGAINT